MAKYFRATVNGQVAFTPEEEAEWERELAERQAFKVANEYKEKRALEYPSFIDYLDGVVKGDQAQVQAYIDACLAVKDKYPKP
jgi:hypothetical protein